MTTALKSGTVTCLLAGLLACIGVSDAHKSITATAGFGALIRAAASIQTLYGAGGRGTRDSKLCGPRSK